MNDFGGFFDKLPLVSNYNHNGTSISAVDIVPYDRVKDNVKVYSPIDGNFQLLPNGNCGNYGVRIYNDKYEVILCHMLPSGFIGKQVSKGQAIGIMGDSGAERSEFDNRHLHIQAKIKRNNRYEWITDAYTFYNDYIKGKIASTQKYKYKLNQKKEDKIDYNYDYSKKLSNDDVLKGAMFFALISIILLIIL